jgi:hypothetical protein
MDQLRELFRPHQFVNEPYIDLFHVYDNLSRTQYEPGIGIYCEDPNEYYMNAWHVIAPPAMRKHLDWYNRSPTQFVSFYDNKTDASQEWARRRRCPVVPGGKRRDPNSVLMAHVRLPRGTKVWFFSRQDMLVMMGAFGGTARQEMLQTSGAKEWFVWGVVPEATPDAYIRIVRPEWPYC